MSRTRMPLAVVLWDVKKVMEKKDGLDVDSDVAQWQPPNCNVAKQSRPRSTAHGAREFRES